MVPFIVNTTSAAIKTGVKTKHIIPDFKVFNVNFNLLSKNLLPWIEATARNGSLPYANFLAFVSLNAISFSTIFELSNFL